MYETMPPPAPTGLPSAVWFGTAGSGTTTALALDCVSELGCGVPQIIFDGQGGLAAALGEAYKDTDCFVYPAHLRLNPFAVVWPDALRQIAYALGAVELILGHLDAAETHLLMGVLHALYTPTVLAGNAVVTTATVCAALWAEESEMAGALAERLDGTADELWPGRIGDVAASSLFENRDYPRTLFVLNDPDADDDEYWEAGVRLSVYVLIGGIISHRLQHYYCRERAWRIYMDGVAALSGPLGELMAQLASEGTVLGLSIALALPVTDATTAADVRRRQMLIGHSDQVGVLGLDTARLALFLGVEAGSMIPNDGAADGVGYAMDRRTHMNLPIRLRACSPAEGIAFRMIYEQHHAPDSQTAYHALPDCVVLLAYETGTAHIRAGEMVTVMSGYTGADVMGVVGRGREGWWVETATGERVTIYDGIVIDGVGRPKGVDGVENAAVRSNGTAPVVAGEENDADDSPFL